jgi:hypothetical protein
LEGNVDEDDKVRRNLVMFSAAILLVAWLDVPIQGILQETLKFKTDVAQGRTWAAALVILAYLLLRYRFSEDAQSLVGGMDREFGGEVYTRVSKYATTRGEKRFADGAPDVAFGERMRIVRETFQAEFPHEYEAAKWDMEVDPRDVASYWSGTVVVTVYAGTEPEERKHLRSYPVTYKMPFMRRVPLALWAFCRSWVYSETSINYLTPVLMGVVAMIVVVWKLTVALLA